MSAIAGIFRFGGAPVEPGSVERITQAMAASGRDGIGHWQQGPVALGQCLLRTSKESAGDPQPLRTDDRQLVLVMDGRLDNRDELQRSLRSRGVSVRSPSDAELVLRAYELWDSACVEHLLGDFAFAIWDARRQQLFCAVDPMGACQLCYATGKDFFAFASTEDALLQVDGVSGAPDETRIAYWLVPAFQTFDRNSSWLRDVKMLQAGQLATVGRDTGVEAKTYWQPQPGQPLQFASAEEARQEFEDVFLEAVRARSRNTGSLAQMLSGGLDSASVRAARRLVASPSDHVVDRSYSAISDDPETCIESQCIQSLAHGGDASFVSVPSFRGMVDVDDLVRETWAHVHPVDNTLTLPALMCLAASRKGERVMLHGASGDVTTNVPLRYPAYLMHAGEWTRAWHECRLAARNNTFIAGAPSKLLLLNAWTAFAPSVMKAAAHRVIGRSHLLEGVNQDFADRLAIDQTLRAHSASSRMLCPNIHQDQAQVLHSRHGLSTGLIGMGRLGKRYGLEMRDPWADKRVVEYFLRLPLDLKIRDGWTKWMVRSSFVGQIEDKLRWRLGKEHLGWHFTHRVMDASRDLVRESFEQDAYVIEPYVDIRTIRQYLDRFLRSASQQTPQSADDSHFLYKKIVMIQWLKRIASYARRQ